MLVDTQNCQISTGGTLPIPNHNFWSPYWIFWVYFCCNIPGRNVSQGNRRNHRKHACKDNTLFQRIRSAGSLLLDWAHNRSNQMMVWGVCLVFGGRIHWTQPILPVLVFFVNSYLLPFGLLFHVATSYIYICLCKNTCKYLSSKGCCLLAKQISIEFFFRVPDAEQSFVFPLLKGQQELAWFPTVRYGPSQALSGQFQATHFDIEKS